MFDDLVEECYSTMRHDNMDISHLMVHYEQLKESRHRIKIRDASRARSSEGCSSKGRLEIQDKSKFKKRLSNQFTSKFYKAHDIMVSNPRSNREEVVIHQVRSLLVPSVVRNMWVNI